MNNQTMREVANKTPIFLPASWVAADKQRHALAGIVTAVGIAACIAYIAGIANIVLNLKGFPFSFSFSSLREIMLVASVATVILVGTVKEMKDVWTGEGHFEVADALWTIIPGVLTAFGIYFLLNYFR